MDNRSLTREDLIYILNSVLKLSLTSNNGLVLNQDGLYVESHTVHSSNASLHMPSQAAYNIVNLLGVDQQGRLTYNGNVSTIKISTKEGNALVIDSDDDGLYVKEIPSAVQNHFDNSSIHVSVEDRTAWNNSLQAAKSYTNDEINKLTIQKIMFVQDVPQESEADPTIIYAVVDDMTAEAVTLKMYVNDHYVNLNITKTTLNNYYTKTEANNRFLSQTGAAQIYLPNTNATNLQAIRKDPITNHPIFEGYKVLSTRANNGLTVDSDGGLYFPDLEAEMRSLALNSEQLYSKVNLYDDEIDQSGRFFLKDDINNYCLILIDYYYKPSVEEGVIDNVPRTTGYAKSVMVDPDTMEYLYEQGIDYYLECVYGKSNYSTKIHMHNDNIYINYYHDICIYKITGIGTKSGNYYGNGGDD